MKRNRPTLWFHVMKISWPPAVPAQLYSAGRMNGLSGPGTQWRMLI